MRGAMVSIAFAVAAVGVGILGATGASGVAGEETTARAAAKKPVLVVRPGRVASGDRIRIVGRKWPAKRKVELLVGEPQSEAFPFKKVRTNRRGKFRTRLKLTNFPAGRWIVLGCRRGCRMKAKDSFRVLPARAQRAPKGSKRKPLLYSELPRETYRVKPRRAAYGFVPTFISGAVRKLKLGKMNWKRWGKSAAKTRAKARFCESGEGGKCGKSRARVRATDRMQYEGTWFYGVLRVTLPKSAGVSPRRFPVCVLPVACPQ